MAILSFPARHFVVRALIPASFIAAFTLTGANDALSVEEGDPIVATINGESIRFSDLRDFQEMLPEEYLRMPIKEVYPALLDHAVDAKLIERAGYRDGLIHDVEVRQRLKQAESRIVQKVYLERFAENRVREEDIRALYDKTLADIEPVEEVRVRQILVETEADAEDILEALDSGEDFAGLATTRSLSPDGSRGGDLGYIRRNEVAPAFAEAVFALNPGETSSPVKTQHGWHVIRVVDRRLSSPPRLADAESQLRAALLQKAMTEHVRDLRRKADIELFGLDGVPLGSVSKQP